MYVAKYRKLGFSHEDIAEILQKDIEAGKVIYSEGVCGHQLCITKYHVNVSVSVAAASH